MSEWRFLELSPDDEFNGSSESYAITRSVHNFVRESIQNVYDQRLDSSKPAGVKFDFYDLSGENLDRFLTDINWNSGLREHLEICAKANNHDKTKLTNNLKRLASGEMRVLIISDYNTSGLTGPEFGEEGNFCKLCRNKMIPSEERGSHSRGGAFGIGKSVYWAFSGFNTVVFSSVFTNDDGQLASRVFGRTYLPDHKQTHGSQEFRYSGNGNMCRLEDGLRHSLTFTEANIASGSLLHREPGQSGTTIAVLMFDDRDNEDVENLEQVARNFNNAIIANYWPLLHEKLLEATVAWTDSTGRNGQIDVEIPLAFAPLTRALDCSQAVDIFKDNPDGRLLDESETAFFSVSIDLPERIDPEDSHPPRPQLPIAVSLTRLSNEEKLALLEFEENYKEMKFLNGFSSIRNPRMVVENRQFVKGNCADHVGVIRAGLYRALNEESRLDDDALVERFLRDSEPPAHDKWTFTDKISQLYKKPWKKVVPDLFNEIETCAKKLLRAELLGSQDRPHGLADKLRINTGRDKPGGTTPPPPPPPGAAIIKKTIRNVAWNFDHKKVVCEIDIEYHVGKKPGQLPSTWTTTIGVGAIGETGKEALPLINATCEQPITLTPIGGAESTTHYSIVSPISITRVTVSLTASLSQIADSVVKKLRIDRHDH